MKRAMKCMFLKIVSDGFYHAILISIFFLSVPLLASAAQGPVQNPLVVTKLSIADYSPNIPYVYVEFNGSSMPGCYGTQGGILYRSNVQFKEIYALLLTLRATNGRGAGSVIFTDNNLPGPIGLQECTLDGIDMR